MEQAMLSERSRYYFEQAPVHRSILHMAVPMMIGMALNMIYSIVDAWFIGRLQNTAMLSAVTLALPLMTVLMAIGNLFGAGGSSYLSRLLGEGDYQTARAVSSVTAFLSHLAGIILMLPGILLLTPPVRLLGASGDTVIPTMQFTLVLLIGSPILIANFALGQLIRSEGSSTASMVGMVISVVLNIALDPLLIFACHMGVAGAALGTVLANLGSNLYYFYFM